MIGRLGWVRDDLDHNDYSPRAFKDVELPPQVDLRQWCPPVMNQGNLGSCTAHGATGAARYYIIKQGLLPDSPMARLQLYYDSRALEGTINSDAGAQIRDVIKTMATKGVAHESNWPYDEANWAMQPPANVYADAETYKALLYTPVNVDTNAVMKALAAGHPVVVGLSLYESFDAAYVGGVVPMPIAGEDTVGGHCMYVVGYGQKPGYFTVRNSWGEDWGDKGDCYIPMGYLASPKYGADYWIVDTFGRDPATAPAA